MAMRRNLALHRIGLALAAMAACVHPALAAPAKADTLAKAAQAAGIRARAMPDEKATAAALKADGFTLAEADGQFKVFFAEGRRVAVGVTVEANSRVACLVTASQMTTPEARSLIQPWIKLADAEPMPLPPANKVAAAWRGTFRGGPVEMAVLSPSNWVNFQGAAIVARSAR